MRTLIHVLRAAAVAAIALAAVFFTSPAYAIDKVVLKDGTVVEGTIVREVDGFVWIKTNVAGIEQEKLFTPQEITRVTRDAGAEPVSSEPVVAADARTPKPVSGGPKAAVITLGSREPGHGDTIGIDIQAYELREMLPLLEEELGTDGTGVVVFRVTSGGGLLLEIQRLSDVIHNEYKKRFRVVAWIDSAISAAAMTSHCMEEIYFTPQGNYGACTGWSGALQAVKGRGLEEVLYMMEKISARGGYNPLIMRAMQIQVPLSATIDAHGEVKWYDDATSGEILVNRDNEILTFNAETARQVKFSRGTANTIEELQALMGYKELQWVGKREKGYTWPISKAEAWNLNWRKKVHEDEEKTQLYFVTYQRQVAAAASEPLETRGKFVNMARATLNKLREAVKRNPNMALLTFGVFTEEEVKEFFDREEKRLRDLMR
ncbi:MAG: hypothetical protein HBSAPP03_26360 [Phycisphaerae bacterium]|nr:MAG: hypothetical protein HBSAPP03_26360 [Phycisphaerae bacterium]